MGGGGVEEEEEAWAVVLLGLGFFLGLLGGFLHLQKERAGVPQLVLIGLVLVVSGPRSTRFD